MYWWATRFLLSHRHFVPAATKARQLPGRSHSQGRANAGALLTTGELGRDLGHALARPFFFLLSTWTADISRCSRDGSFGLTDRASSMGPAQSSGGPHLGSVGCAACVHADHRSLLVPFSTTGSFEWAGGGGDEGDPELILVTRHLWWPQADGETFWFRFSTKSNGCRLEWNSRVNHLFGGVNLQPRSSRSFRILRPAPGGFLSSEAAQIDSTMLGPCMPAQFLCRASDLLG